MWSKHSRRQMKCVRTWTSSAVTISTPLNLLSRYLVSVSWIGRSNISRSKYRHSSHIHWSHGKNKKIHCMKTADRCLYYNQPKQLDRLDMELRILILFVVFTIRPINRPTESNIISKNKNRFRNQQHLLGIFRQPIIWMWLKTLPVQSGRLSADRSRKGFHEWHNKSFKINLFLDGKNIAYWFWIL